MTRYNHQSFLCTQIQIQLSLSRSLSSLLSFFLFYGEGLASFTSLLPLLPAAPPPAPSSLQRSLGEALRHLLSTRTGLGVLGLSPSFSRPRGIEAPPARQLPGRCTAASPGPGRRRRNLPARAAPGAPESQSAARPPPHLLAAGPPPTPPRCPAPHFSQAGKFAESQEIWAQLSDTFKATRMERTAGGTRPPGLRLNLVHS
ncbi:formin-like protein 7 [Trachypithecus francoisi]|uniref:formin-like protein 7 n=1 Tax=Trachypithecus francoisi TaxID=54180 RepID=UPI00141B8CD7|nr:formin-like protein 7 [Trachypithecus francoisi]